MSMSGGLCLREIVVRGSLEVVDALLVGLAVSKSAMLREYVCEYVYAVEMMVQKGSPRVMVTRGAAACIVLLDHEVIASCKRGNDADFETGNPVGG